MTCCLCHGETLPGEAVASCPECGAVYHEECFADNGGCGTYGCSRVPKDEAQAATVAPTFWGQETKTCPKCGQSIRAAALRCRHCNARFDSAAPVEKAEYDKQVWERGQIRRLQILAPWMFILGIIPCTAPIVLLVGGPMLYVSGRALLARAKPSSRILASIGVAVAGLWVVLSILVFVIS